jgi:ABC-type multidrug transport system fused ATPase/permease subunit
VDFSYGGTPVLRAVSLCVEPGVCVAVVGPNGAGKTTLLDLVIGFARPSAGAITADGVPYDDLDLIDVRRSIGMVPQHPGFFAGTVRENLIYGRPEATREEVAAAVRLALGEAFMRRAEHGYDTEMSETGAPFSAGECQRLAIARALLGDPRLLILDEPTTHLDAASVHTLMTALLNRPKRPAILIVTHDPEVVRFAGRVWRLDAGSLHRAGTEPVTA